MSKAYTNFASSQSAKRAATAATSVSAPIVGRESEMVVNNTGGFTFSLDKWGVLDRFIMIGSEGGNYYVGERDITKQGFDTIKACIKEDGKRVVARLLEYSVAGRAPKNDPAVVGLALAAVYGDDETKAAAFEALPKIARTGTWLFLFVSILDSLGKWNAAAKRGVAAWYNTKTLDRLAVQLLKYQSRNGWAHRDVLRLAHVKPTNDAQSNLFRYAVGKDIELGANVPQLLVDFEHLKRAKSAGEVLRVIEGNKDVTWEMVPTEFHKNVDVMMALLPNMGLTAVIRKLGVLTANGVIAPLSAGAKLVINKLSDAETLQKQRVHPITLLQALKTYQQGHGEKGSTTWRPEQRVIDALNDAFYAAFGHVEKTNDNYFLGVDCSGSMSGSRVNGSPNLTAVEVAGVMAMAIVKNQPNYWVGGFNHVMGELKITPNMRLDAVIRTILAFNWGMTDCSLPFKHASKNKMHVDRFVIITDNEVNCGTHPAQAAKAYRNQFNEQARQVVIGTSVSEFTIADPKDPRDLDIAGFDSAAPQIIATF